MPARPNVLPVGGSLEELTRALVDTESPSGNEERLADLIQAAVHSAPHLEVLRMGNTVAARTNLGRPQRVVWAGHIDTIPPNANVPSSTREGWLWGRGSVDMKAGVAVGLKAALELQDPPHDATWIFYDNEEVEAAKNGLGLFGAAHPEWVRGDLAVVGEPTNAAVEAGCNGTIRIEVTARGTRAHSARAWMGENAIHLAGGILDTLRAYPPAAIEVDGLVYREGLQAVGISGGVAGNVIPDACTVTVNYRFAPDKTIEHAIEHLRGVFSGFEVAVVDQAGAARPGLDRAFVRGAIERLGVEVGPKYGWTDVARFGAWGIPAINYGPGDPSLAHADDERVEIAQIEAVYAGLVALFSATD